MKHFVCAGGARGLCEIDRFMPSGTHSNPSAAFATSHDSSRTSHNRQNIAGSRFTEPLAVSTPGAAVENLKNLKTLVHLNGSSDQSVFCFVKS